MEHGCFPVDFYPFSIRKNSKIRKKFIEIFKKHNLKIEIKICKIADFLDVTFDLNRDIFKTYRKPNDDPHYVHTLSNHPATVIKQIPKSISKRISSNSATKEIFQDTAKYYNDILEKSGYKEKITDVEKTENRKRNRNRKVIWYNPPFSKNVKTKIGFHFINLIDKHFGDKGNILNKIFNRNTIKLSFSCMPNMGKIIKAHNSKLMNTQNHQSQQCNCRVKANCPLSGDCMVENIVYEARVTLREANDTPMQTTTDQTNETQTQMRPTRTTRPNSNKEQPNANNTTTTNAEDPQPDKQPYHNAITKHHEKQVAYIGAAENFKQRYRNHLKSFRHNVYRKETELSKYIWTLKDQNINYSIDWKILRRTSGYNKASKICKLCLSEKFEICTFKNRRILLNKRNELVSKCRHENKHLLSNLPDP